LAGIWPYSNHELPDERGREGMTQDQKHPLDRPSILFVATDLSTGGGVNKVIRDLAALFTEKLGARVSVVNARSNRASAYAFPAEVPVQMQRKQSLPAYFALLLRLRRSRPDYVIGSWTQDNLLLTLAFLFSATKVVLIEHSSWHFHGRFIRALRRIVYPFAWRVVVLNPTDLEHYRQFLGNVRLIPDPVSAPPRLTQREKLIIAVGHLLPVKNFADAIGAFAKSGLEDEDWSLTIIGSGAEDRMLCDLIRDIGLRRTSIRTGREDLGEWYSKASLLLVTSRRESFSLVLAEAMASGVVPIAYASDGPSFILQDFPDHLIDLGAVDALAERIAAFAHEPALDQIRVQLAQSVAWRFSPEIIADQWREVLS
jgi:glycosyltransferase involved in cell wall biosynthesis